MERGHDMDYVMSLDIVSFGALFRSSERIRTNEKMALFDVMQMTQCSNKKTFKKWMETQEKLMVYDGKELEAKNDQNAFLRVFGNGF